MSQFFKKIRRVLLKKTDNKKIELESESVKVTGVVEELVEPIELNLDSVGTGGKDFNYTNTSKSYNLFAVKTEEGPSLVASLNLDPGGFENNELIGKVLVNPNTEEIIAVKYDYVQDNSIENVISIDETANFNPDTSLKKITINNWSLSYTGSLRSWNSITYGNGLFVAVDNSISGTNLVLYSNDGINWSETASGINNAWSSVTYGNNLFVAVANSGTSTRVMTSSNGINWNGVSAPTQSWNSITYGAGLFVAVSSSGTGSRVMTSSNAIEWTLVNTPADNNWTSVTYGGGLFVAVSSSGTGNRIMTSPNGINWTLRSSPADNSWSGVTYGDGKFVAVASGGVSNRVMYSSNGITWTVGNYISEFGSSSAVDGSDGDLVINNGQTVTVPEGSVKKYSSINIASGGFLVISGNGGGWTEIGCAGDCVIDGQIIARAGTVGSSTHSSGTFSKNSSFGLGRLNYSITQKIGGRGGDTPGISYSYSKNVPAPPFGTGRRKKTYSKSAGGGTGGSQYLGGGGGGAGESYRVGSGDGAIMLKGGSGGRRFSSGFNKTQSGANPYPVAYRSYKFGGSGGSYTKGNNQSSGSGGSGWAGGGGGDSGGGGGGYKGIHGKGLVLFVEGTVSGNGSIIASGTNGLNGGNAGSSSSGGRGAGGAGGSGGSVVIRYNGGDVPFIDVSGGAGGSQGTGRAAPSDYSSNGQAGDKGSVTYINVSENSFNNTWKSVSYGNGFFVAVADSGVGTRLMFSDNGIDWQLLNVNYENSWKSITFGNTNFVAVSDSTAISGFHAIRNLKF
jgi:hypothetical protein